jgi:hypothetical protein
MGYGSNDMQLCNKCGGEIRGEVCPQCLPDEKGGGLPAVRSSLKRFTPNYSELSLYSMALTAALVLVFYKECGEVLSSVLDKEEAFIILVYFGVGLLALFLCIYHAFVKKRKTELEKKLMLSFATLTNLVSGVLAGTHAFEHASGLYAIFPLFNLLNCFMLVLFMKFNIITVDNISDENVPLWQVAVSSVTIIAVFLLFKTYLDRQWYLTLSACIFYATNINRPVIVVLGNLSPKKGGAIGRARPGRKDLRTGDV